VKKVNLSRSHTDSSGEDSKKVFSVEGESEEGLRHMRDDQPEEALREEERRSESALRFSQKEWRPGSGSASQGLMPFLLTHQSRARCRRLDTTMTATRALSSILGERLAEPV